MEGKSERKFKSTSTSKIENTLKYSRNVTNSLAPSFQGAGDASLLHWWHVFMSMLGWPCFYVNVRLAIDPSLAKLAKRIGDLGHRLAIL